MFIEKLSGKNSPKKAIIEGFSDGFLKINKEVFLKTNKEISEKEKMILLILLIHMNNKTKTAFPSVEKIMEVLGSNNKKFTSSGSVYSCIRNLEKKKYIQQKPNSLLSTDGSGNRIKITYNTYKILNKCFGGKKDYWEKIPKGIIVSNKLEWQDRLFLIQLYSIVLLNVNEIRYSNREISKKIGVATSSVGLKTNKLVELGYLEPLKDSFGFRVDIYKMFEMDGETINSLLQENSKLRLEKTALSKELKKKNKEKEEKQLEDSCKDVILQEKERKCEMAKSLKQQKPEKFIYFTENDIPKWNQSDYDSLSLVNKRKYRDEYLYLQEQLKKVEKYDLSKEWTFFPKPFNDYKTKDYSLLSKLTEKEKKKYLEEFTLRLDNYNEVW